MLPQNQGPSLPLMTDKAILFYICTWSSWVPPYVLYGLVHGEVSWYCSSFYGVINLFSFFSSSPNSSIGVPALRLTVGCDHPHLYWSGSGRDSQRIAIPGSCQQAFLSISNSFWVWCLHMGWIRRWGSFYIAFPLGSVPLIVPTFSLEKNNSGLQFLRWISGPIPQTGVVLIHWI